MNARAAVLRQFETAWALADYHLATLTTEECLWRPAAVGLHVHRGEDGAWRADWPTSEGYEIGPPSIGWVTWHIGFWWSMVLDRSFGPGSLEPEAVTWPGDVEGVRSWIGALKDRWLGALNDLEVEAWASAERTRWPFRDRPFGDVAAWVNIELTKNAAEIGYARFLFAVKD
ncbi:MAG TPA: DinB family protein [Caulobacter sp.]|nr:DinB family protein [Caulobacter sp.]